MPSYGIFTTNHLAIGKVCESVVVGHGWTQLVTGTNWQAARAKTRQPYLPKLVVLAGTPCHFCGCPRSSHSLLVLQAHCKSDGCGCPVFDPLCGCGHLLGEHTWGTPPNPWECAFCPCKRFGADMTGTKERRPTLEVMLPPLPAKPSLPKPAPTVNVAETGNGKVSWGRRSLNLYDCGRTGCADLATYWTSRTSVFGSGKVHTVKVAWCGPHFRKWANTYIPDNQLTLF